jgi:quercetin dioxygenase-like cupin family protein
MESMSQLGAVPPRQIWDGVLARIVEGEELTVAIVEIEPGKRVPEHRHINEQIGFVIRGEVTFTVGHETKTLGPGGTWRILADVPHHVDVGPDGAIVAEAYAPVRADWQGLDQLQPRTPRWPGEA